MVTEDQGLVIGGQSVKFSSTFSSYLTMIGLAVGMGDVWRFPFLVLRNGGGAFLVPYIVMVIVCGVPIYFLEYSIGKFSGRGPYTVWDICPLFRGVGITISFGYFVYIVGSSIFRCWLMLLVIYAFKDPLPWSHCGNEWNTPFCKDNLDFLSNRTNNVNNRTGMNVIGLNQSDIKASLSHVVYGEMTTPQSNISGIPMTAVEEFWQYELLQLSTGISDLSPVIWQYFLLLFILRLAICFGAIKSIKSIEKVIYVTVSVPFIVTVVVFIRSLMLPGAGDGILFFFLPEFNTLLKARVWIEAALMAFYSLGFGWGALILMASHSDFKDNCLRAAVVIPAIDAILAIFGGMVCFSILGNMAHSYNVNITEVINGGMSTGIVAYLTAMLSLPTSQIWTGLFLISVLLTGVESQLIPFEMIVQSLQDIFPRLKRTSRTALMLALTAVMYGLSLPTCTGGGGYIFLWIDWYSGAWIGPIVAVIEVTTVAWIYGLDRFSDDVHMMTGRPIPAILRIALAVVSPAVVMAIFCTGLVEYVPPRYGSYSYPTITRILGWTLVAIIMIPIIVQAIHVVRLMDGSLITKLKEVIKPNKSWGPSSEESKPIFLEKRAIYSHRTFKDLLHFNLFGRYPTSSIIHEMSKQTLQEMERLPETMKTSFN